VNAVRLRRLLPTLEGEDYPADPRRVYRQLRQATLAGTLEIPEIDLDKDLGGYDKVKARLKAEIIDVMKRKDDAADPDAIRRIEDLIPRGMIFWGPPGTGKTLFAKAMAAALGAAITVVSGPELKSKWVGESEDNLRQIFRKARQSAPAIIVFDELDSFATARGTYAGSGVEHSMVNQLLTEMDGFHKEELVFVIGTTNFVESLDPALLRPGRFEFHLHIPHPDIDDRRAIFAIYDRKMGLQLTPEGLDYAVKATADYVPGTAGARYTGDHINALCRAMARIRLREEKDGPSGPEDIERAMTEWIERADMTPAEELVVATHEVGHAVCSLFCDHATPIDRISIQGNLSGALGFVRYQDKAHRYVTTRAQLLDDLCILMGGREAEKLMLEDLSIGSADDLRRATAIARALVEEFGLGGDEVGVRRFIREEDRQRQSQLSQAHLEAIDREVSHLLDKGRRRAEAILSENRPLVEALRAELLERKVIDAKALGGFLEKKGIHKEVQEGKESKAKT
jgi:cell division protease FtsH